MNRIQKIGVFDSGIGGKTILKVIKKHYPKYHYKYIADSKNCPYGEKQDPELFQIVSKNVEELIEWGAQIIVIACNTATTRCLGYLKEKYPMIRFVGTEPAVGEATKTGAKKILVLATPGTIKSERLQELIRENQKPNQEIKTLACPGLARAIEDHHGVKKVLGNLLCNVEKDFDIVVLGCTHYPYAVKHLKHYFENAIFIDSGEEVAKKLGNELK